MSSIRRKCRAAALLVSFAAAWAPAGAAPATRAGAAADAPAGTIEVSGFSLPPSSFASPESQRALADMLGSGKPPAAKPAPLDVPERRAEVERELAPKLAAAAALYAVKTHAETLAGVGVTVVEPAGGVPSRNRNRVLIELAGGAFTMATPAAGMLESMPVAALGGFRVVSLHYRQGPEFRFPAATEDVAAVYAELLKHHRADAIGIYGCSSGAYLTTMALAWFQVHHLPRPGAVALLCGSAGRIFEGDSFFTGPALTGHAVPLAVTPEHPIVQVEYMRDIKADDPLAMPVEFPEVLAKFPPTLFITGTRDVALSSAAYLHGRLFALGVKADLHVWDGMWHGFMSNPQLPESHQAMSVISTFFDRELAR